MKVNWFGAYGYGDCIRSMGYANTFARKTDTPIELNIHWSGNDTEKFHSTDPESKYQRYITLQDEISIDYNMVDIRHHFNSRDTVYQGIAWKEWDKGLHLPRFFPVFDQGLSLHALVKPKKPRLINKNQICIWTPTSNIHSLYQWKNPLKEWNTFRGIVKAHGYDIVEMSYREPIKDAIEKVATSEFCCGYGGMGKGLAGLFWKPLVSITERPNNTYRETPWAYPVDNLRDFHNLPTMIEESIKRIPIVQRDYNRYINNQGFKIERYDIF